MMKRRYFLQGLLLTTAALLMAPARLLAAIWNKPAFEATTLDGANQGLQISAAQVSSDIEIILPQKAENGAVVQIEVMSRIPNTESVLILAEKNPTPLIANFQFAQGTEPYVVTRIKLAETGDVQVIVKADKQYFTASRRIEVLENGCG